MIRHLHCVRFALVACLVALCPAFSVGASDQKEPYRIRIVFCFTKHPLLTKVFKERVARELKDGVQAALGELAKVEVASDDPKREHPKVKDIRKLGLGRGLDGFSERSAYQTHFVQIDFTGTVYDIQTRQHDGLIDRLAPVVRSARTHDPAYVARTTALLMEREIGLLGTVESEPDERGLVQVALKGGKLGVDLGRWVKKGEVFAVMRGTGDAPMKWVVLQVAEPATDGVCSCRVYPPNLRGLSTTGLRCVLLGTRKGPVRVRFVHQTKDGGTRPGLPPSVGIITVQIRHNGFKGEETTLVQFTSNGARDLDSSVQGDRGMFNKLAFVTILLPGASDRFVNMPVPLVDDSLVALPVPETNAQDHPLLFRLQSLRRDVTESNQVQSTLFKRINELTAKPEKRVEALAEVRKTLERSQQDHLKLSSEREEIQKEVYKLPKADRPSDESLDATFRSIKKRMDEIKEGEKELLRHLTVLEKIEKEESDPKRKEWLFQLERANGLVKDLELGEAIAIYEKAPAEFQTEELTKRLEDLKKKWKTRGPQHEEARRFIYKEWPELTTSSMTGKVAEAQKALDVCIKVDDVVGVAKLRKGIDKHVERLDKEYAALNVVVNIDDEKKAKVLQGLIRELRGLDKASSAYLDKKGS
jgi:hypothetical protein